MVVCITMPNTVNLVVPERLVKRAKVLGVNCSEEARKAIAAAVARKEKAKIVRASVPTPNPDNDQTHSSSEVKGQ